MAGSRFDEAGKGLNKPIGLPTNQERSEIADARRHDQTIGKFAREARKNGDLKGYMEAVNAGYRNRGIENSEDKDNRYREIGHQRFKEGSAAVGGGQGAGGAQQPAGGFRGPAQAGDAPIEGRDAQGRPISMLDEEERPVSPINGNRPALASGAAPTGTQPAAPAKPNSFFEERASGRQAFVDTVGSLRGKEGGMTSKEAEQAKARGAALGLTPEQVQATLDGETELSPEAIAGRAKDRKDEKTSDRNEAEQGMRDSIDGANMAEVNDILNKGAVRSFEQENRQNFDASGIAQRQEERKEFLRQYEIGEEQRINTNKTLYDEVKFKSGERQARSEEAYRVQQRLESDHYEKVIAAEEWKQREQGKNELSQTYNFMTGKEAPEVGDAPGAMDYKNFDPNKNPKAHSKEEQARINEDQDRRMAKLRGVKYEPRADVDLMSREEFLKHSGKTVRESEAVLKKNAEDKIRTDKGHEFGQSLSDDLSHIGSTVKDGLKGAVLETFKPAIDSVDAFSRMEVSPERKQKMLERGDQGAAFGDYLVGRTGDAKTPTRESISKYAKENKISVKEAGNILRKKSAEARGEKFTPQASINLEKPSKEFRSAYDNLKALEQFTV